MVENRDAVLGYHFGSGGHRAECNGGICRHLRLVVSVLAAGFLPRRNEAGGVSRYYSERFSTVELNTTGYRLPREELFERWADQMPAGFRFAPKMNAYRNLNVATFEERVSLLGERLGPIRARRDLGA